MTIRENWELCEEKILSPYAALSKNSTRGREEDPCEVRTAFVRDRDRILHSKAFRRLKHKTQVFVSPGDHFRTRLTHTLEVNQIARTIARALSLNEDLTEAISLGHDLGHAPFGHGGESVIDDILERLGADFSFKHNQQSLRVVDLLEKEGRGLNLTNEVRDGILHHTGKQKPMTLEGQIVKIADRVAYLNHDADDAIRGNILKLEDLPPIITDYFGATQSDRIDAMVKDLIYNSMGQDEIKMSDKMKEGMKEFRNFMFENVYLNSDAKKEDHKITRLLEELYRYYLGHEEELPEEFNIRSEDTILRRITDYVAGMTDSYAVEKFTELFIPLGYRE